MRVNEVHNYPRWLLEPSASFPKFHALVWLVIAVGLCGGCRKDRVSENSTPNTGPSASPPGDRVFTFAEVGAETFDPNLIAEASGNRVGSQLFEPLLVLAADNGPPQPGQATRWTVSDDGTKYTFYLRKDAVWSDGKKIVAADHLYSWQRALNPKTNSRNAEHYWVITGAKAYNKGDTVDFGSVGVKAIDDYTIEVQLVGAAPYFLDLLTYVVFSPVPRHVIEKHGKHWTRPEHIVSNGAFRLTKHKLRDHLVLEKNPLYWDAKNTWLDKAIMYDIEGEKNAHDWYERGKVMWTPGSIPVDQVAALKKSGRPDYRIDPILCVYYYVLNCQKPPMNDLAVRRAVNMAIDKGRIVRQILGQGQKPATHVVPPLFKKLRNYMGVDGAPFDPARARKILAKAGYGPGKKPLPKFTISYNTFEGHRLIAEFVQRSLLTHLGIEVKINNMEWRSLLPRLQNGDFEVGRSGWCADFPDPQDFVQVFHSDAENNYSNYRNPAFDAVIDELRRTPDQQTRNALSAKAEQMLNNDVPLLPLYFYTRGQMLRTFVKGMSPQIQGRYLFKRIYFEKAEK